jgi:hypothetical protein
VETLSEDPSLRLALVSGSPPATGPSEHETTTRVSRELQALAHRGDADVLAVVAADQRILASAGRGSTKKGTGKII